MNPLEISGTEEPSWCQSTLLLIIFIHEKKITLSDEENDGENSC